MFFLTLENLKIVLPSRRELNFCIIAFFKLYPETLEKSSKKALDFEVKIEKNQKKNVSKKNLFSDCVFLSIFGGFGQIWGGVWEGFGASWRLLGHFLASFLEACIQNALRRVLRGLFESFGKVLGRLWEGFGKAFGQESGLQFCLTFLDVLVCFWARIFRRSRI